MGLQIPVEIVEALDRGQTVLTASQRAARTLRLAYDEAMRELGTDRWQPPAIFALDTWLPGLWHQMLVEGTATRLLLNRVQEHSLWRAIVAADREVPGLRSADTLAELAAEAWRLVWLYQGRGRMPEFGVSTDTRAFARWSDRFERACARHQYMSSAQIAATLEEALANGELPLSDAGLLLVDVDQIAPAHAQMFEAMRRAGFAVDLLTTARPAETASLVAAQDDAAELRAAAAWARSHVGRDNAVRLALVVPDLADCRARIERVFAAVLAPDAFEFSLGRPLAETALVATALDLLRWPMELLPLETISRLLLSPFVAGAGSDALAAAAFDANVLRGAKLLRPELSLEAFLTLATKHQFATLLPLLRALRRAARAEQMADASQSYAAWADAFRNVLEAAGWTALAGGDSATFQAQQRWESALDELATLDFEGAHVDGSAALETLTRIVRQTIFAPESRDAPVQILGPLELGGIGFDALWFLGADDRKWPVTASPHPLIPWHVQRDLGMPGADAARDTTRAQALTQRIAGSADAVVFSYAVHVEEGEQRVSPLLRELGLAMTVPAQEAMHAPLAFDEVVDAEPLPALPEGATHGGARLLELQAACGFRAFAELRLWSSEPEPREPGLDARERGQLVHDVMQRFWGEIESQTTLIGMSAEEREDFLIECIERAVERTEQAAETPWDAAYLDVQRQRLRALLLPWLAVELERPPFTVERREQAQEDVEVGPLRLRLRVDRVDKTAAGPLIVDYKTGDAAPSQWLSDRPEAPQLPLYAILPAVDGQAPEDLGGVAFALLRAGDKLALKGYAAHPQAVFAGPSKLKFNSLAEQVEDWRRVLTALAVAFAEGDVHVAPKEYPKTCAYCRQRILCRLDPATLSVEYEEAVEALMAKIVSIARREAIADAAERERALDITRSFIVEAPAGSGKTGLLIQRYLKLLASETVTDPAQVLAITFTRKATAELADRVLAALASAQAAIEPANAFDRATRPLAEAVMARDAQAGWSLLDNPHRLNIRTIDSAGMNIAAALPVLSGSGGGQAPEDDSGPLYAEAARRTVMQLGTGDTELNAALELLLLHRDGNLGNCETLIVTMLANRDQWGELVPLAGGLSEEFLDETILPRFDKALDLAVCRGLTRLAQLIPPSMLRRLSLLASEMGALPGYKGADSPIAVCAGKDAPPEAVAEDLAHWRALIHLLVKPSKPRDWRKSFSGHIVGFEIEKAHQAELKLILAEVQHDSALMHELCAIDTLPPAQYPREQWQVAKALFRVLSRALAELQLVFAEQGNCDFAEVGLLARSALRMETASDDLEAASGSRLQHLLVDEMQDTSSLQYEFIQLLTQSWDGSGQTVFLVGDPKQSIYLFRQARVERFVRTLASARLGEIALGVLRLSANFRSQAALVDAFNEDFSRIFPQRDAGNENEIPFEPASATRTGAGERTWHTAVIPHSDDNAVCKVAKRAQAIEHAQEMLALIERWRSLKLPEGRKERWKIAVLIRNRSHLAEVVPVLKQAAIPYRAVDIEPLSERQEILDLVALTRALLHPADRTAWLAMLRAPWCGLSLADLHNLAGRDDHALAETTIFELIQTRGDLLSDDGIARLEPFFLILDAALKQRGRQPLAQWVDRTWRAFGAPAYLAAEELTNAARFFELLDQLEEPGGALSLEWLHERVEKLYAAPSVAPDAIDLMTLHKAKGLEWDFVIVPELQRVGGRNKNRLLSWLELDAPDESAATGILAPIASMGVAAGELNDWMRGIESARLAAERKRLFYVACTRAREELHLFAAPEQSKDGSIKPKPESLLASAWPAAERFFTAPTATVFEMPATVDEPLALAASAAITARVIQRIPTVVAPSLASSVAPLPSPFVRPEGSLAARAFGNAMHTFLERAAAFLTKASSAALLAELPAWQPRIAAVLRAAGLAPAEIERFATNVLRGLAKTLNDPEGQWLLSPHPQAASESAFIAWSAERTSLRLDRTFLAGATPLSVGQTHQWIVDWKTTDHGPQGLEAFLEEQREAYAPQLEGYAQELGSEGRAVRLALYYPMLSRLVWWEPLQERIPAG